MPSRHLHKITFDVAQFAVLKISSISYGCALLYTEPGWLNFLRPRSLAAVGRSHDTLYCKGCGVCQKRTWIYPSKTPQSLVLSILSSQKDFKDLICSTFTFAFSNSFFKILKIVNVQRLIFKTILCIVFMARKNWDWMLVICEVPVSWHCSAV